MSYCILFADDDQATVESLRPLLQQEGYDVLTATDGEEALSVLRQFPVDLVLLDLKMPKRNGVEVLRSLREDLHLTTPVVIFSHVLDWEKERQQVKALMQRHGECHQFLKPVEPDDLLRGLADILHQRHNTPP
ncbi:MAG: response regulator [Elusimicrobia bacterium]|nr:response regulator [Elusimicrobiota bacterium]